MKIEDELVCFFSDLDYDMSELVADRVLNGKHSSRGFLELWAKEQTNMYLDSHPHIGEPSYEIQRLIDDKCEALAINNAPYWLEDYQEDTDERSGLEW